MDLKIMELETKITELELEIMKWNKDIEDIQLGLTLQTDQQLKNLSNSLERKKNEIENIEKELKEKIENDLSKSDKNQILKQLEEVEIARWNYNREIKEIKSDIRDLKECNNDINRKYEEIKESIGLIKNKDKEMKKKRRVVIGIIIWLVISLYMNLLDDIEGIKNKIIREHGYGMTIQDNKEIMAFIQKKGNKYKI